jgi:hypothetical protein
MTRKPVRLQLTCTARMIVIALAIRPAASGVQQALCSAHDLHGHISPRDTTVNVVARPGLHTVLPSERLSIGLHRRSGTCCRCNYRLSASERSSWSTTGICTPLQCHDEGRFLCENICMTHVQGFLTRGRCRHVHPRNTLPEVAVAHMSGSFRAQTRPDVRGRTVCLYIMSCNSDSLESLVPCASICVIHKERIHKNCFIRACSVWCLIYTMSMLRGVATTR